MATDAQDTVVLGVEGVGLEASDDKLESYTSWGLLFSDYQKTPDCFVYYSL